MIITTIKNKKTGTMGLPVTDISADAAKAQWVRILKDPEKALGKTGAAAMLENLKDYSIVSLGDFDYKLGITNLKTKTLFTLTSVQKLANGKKTK